MKDFGIALAAIALCFWIGGLVGSMISDELFTTPAASREFAYSLALIAMAFGVCGRDEK